MNNAADPNEMEHDQLEGTNTSAVPSNAKPKPLGCDKRPFEYFVEEYKGILSEPDGNNSDILRSYTWADLVNIDKYLPDTTYTQDLSKAER